uniref:WRKY protein n=1 Tax=Paeonia lactiflora TaxID=35924 RepID=A0A3R5T0G4_PAELC|nr:WRKY protein [Paeonia lactiflora]
MSNTSFGSPDSLEGDHVNQPDFEFSDYLIFDDWLDENPTSMPTTQNPVYPTIEVDDFGGSSTSHHQVVLTRDHGSGSLKKDLGEKVAFKTKSEVEILDDGFRWRKYGKKMVKNSPNPRNYYRCSVQNCPVKKRVERDREDPRYVITTYEGIHNHLSPSNI